LSAAFVLIQAFACRVFPFAGFVWFIYCFFKSIFFILFCKIIHIAAFYSINSMRNRLLLLLFNKINWSFCSLIGFFYRKILQFFVQLIYVFIILWVIDLLIETTGNIVTIQFFLKIVDVNNILLLLLPFNLTILTLFLLIEVVFVANISFNWFVMHLVYLLLQIFLLYHYTLFSDYF